MELDVVALPNRRCLAGIHLGSSDFINGAAIVVLAFQTVAVQDLHFIPSLDINAAVAPGLSLGFGHVRNSEFYVQLEMAVELLLCDDIAAFDLHDSSVEDRPTRRRFAIGLGPIVQALAVEQN